jgi:hypothetical protein
MSRFIDITGKRFGRLVAQSVHHRHKGRTFWLCRCDCGGESITSGTTLRTVGAVSCGCYQREDASRLHAENLIGQKFGRLTVVERAPRPRMVRSGEARWLCRCECGGMVSVASGSLKSSGVRSCGCLLIEVTSKSPGEASFNTLYSRYRHAAKVRRLPFDLTKDQFRSITQRHCHYCGVEPKQATVIKVRHNGDYIHNGIDRIDSNIGYTVANSAPCCKACNLAKGNMTVAEFLAWLDRISRYQSEVKKLNGLATGEYVLGRDLD